MQQEARELADALRSANDGFEFKSITQDEYHALFFERGFVPSHLYGPSTTPMKNEVGALRNVRYLMGPV